MDVDPLDSLVALGLVSTAEAAAAQARTADVGRFAQLALLGVDVAALVPRLAEIAQLPIAPPDLLDAVPSNAPLLPPELRAALAALPATPVFRAGMPSAIVISDPATRARLRELLGSSFDVYLATEAQVRALATRFLAAPVTNRGSTGPLGSSTGTPGPLAPPSGPGGTKPLGSAPVPSAAALPTTTPVGGTRPLAPAPDMKPPGR